MAAPQQTKPNYTNGRAQTAPGAPPAPKQAPAPPAKPIAAPAAAPGVPRQRRKPKSIDLDETRRAEIVDRVLQFYADDDMSRDTEKALRLQRYAKFRMWTGQKDWPWPNSSNIALPDIMMASQRTQDTLHNSVTGARPVMTAIANYKSHRSKQDTVTNLIDHQVFEDQDGESVIGRLAHDFVNEGLYTAMIPWVRETRDFVNSQIFPPLPPGSPMKYFAQIIRQEFADQMAPQTQPIPKPNSDGWDWFVVLRRQDVDGSDPVEIKFYTMDDDRIEMTYHREVVVFDGPKILPLDWEDVLHPPRVENLQIRSPSNPFGSSHVIVRTNPSIDEVRRLQRVGWYDLMSRDEADVLDVEARDEKNEEQQKQRDALQGRNEQPAQPSQQDAKSHRTLTMLICFDTYDIDKDGIDEDVIFYVLLETKKLLRVRRLTEQYPAMPPRRPFMESSFLPVPGRREGIGLIEMIEGLHDARQILINQTIDFGSVTNSPFFFYRATAQIKPDVMRMSPGEGYPVNDPQRDIRFPEFPQGGAAMALNLYNLLSQESDKTSMVGDLQYGRVPPGRSAALRTTGNMALLSQQGEARPERILRRFYSGLKQGWDQIHQLNQHFLSQKKKIRIVGVKPTEEDAYGEVPGRNGIAGNFAFAFKANVFNASKTALQESLQNLMGALFTPLAVQSGVVGPDQIFTLYSDFAKAWGQDGDRYLKAPTPESNLPLLFGEEVINLIMHDEIPACRPAEGAVEQLTKLRAFIESDNIGHLKPGQQIETLKMYMQQLAERAANEQQMMARVQAAQAAQGAAPGQTAGPGRPAQNAPSTGETPLVQENELIDETMPTAGGGAAAAQGA